MLNLIFLSSLISASISSYDFEIDRGPMLEVKTESQFSDKEDQLSYGAGVRLGYSLANIQDFFLTADLDFSFLRFKREKRLDPSEETNTKYSVSALVTAYEFYNPFSFRLSGGAGLERRLSRYSPLAEYRLGLGYYFSPDWAVYVEGRGQSIFRSSNTSFNFGAGLSLQYIL